MLSQDESQSSEHDSHVDSLMREENEPPQSFTLMRQNKRVAKFVSSMTLCPTMDLIALGVGKSSLSQSPYSEESLIANKVQINADSIQLHLSNTVIIHRTLSWQKLISLSSADISSMIPTVSARNVLSDDILSNFNVESKNSNELDDEVNDQGSENISTSCIRWSPDGRIIAVGLSNGGVFLYDIEASGTPPSPIFYIAPKICSSSCDTPSKIDTIPSSDKKEPIRGSPVMTRSMAAARRKRLQETGDETSHDEKSDTVSSYTKYTSLESKHFKMLEWKANSVVAISWQRISPPHKDWTHDDKDEEIAESWYYQSSYLDRSTDFLPPCDYNNNRSRIQDQYMYHKSDSRFGDSGNSSITSSFPDDIETNVHRYNPAQSPISLLCVGTVAHGIQVYIHGRYHIMSLPAPIIATNKCTTILCSSNLSHVLVSGLSLTDMCENSESEINRERYRQFLRLYSTPQINTQRYNLQIITNAYNSIISHFYTIQNGMKEAFNAWSASLRDLDRKWDQLLILLRKYGVISNADTQQRTVIDDAIDLRRELLNYVLGGHSSRNTDTSSAMDQFFTHPLHMNDQILQRLIRSLESSTAGLEGIIRKKVLNPVRSLNYDVGEFHGFVKSMNSLNIIEDETVLIDSNLSLRLCEVCEILNIGSENLISQAIDMRFRVDHMMKWIRGTAAQVKARGTAMDSVQKENARKRRIAEGNLRQIADYLSFPLKTESNDKYNQYDKNRSLSECILGLLFSDHFVKDKVYVKSCNNTENENYLQSGLYDKTNLTQQVESPSVKYVLSFAFQLANDLWKHPKDVLSKLVRYIDIGFENKCPTISYQIATHQRLGGLQRRGDTRPTCFAPKILTGMVDISTDCKHWGMIAIKCNETHHDRELIQIIAMPFSENNCEMHMLNAENYGQIENLTMVPFYLNAFVLIPKFYKIISICFYGDDGNSTLTSDKSETVEEGRQALGLLLHRSSNIEADEDEIFQELFLFQYDDLEYRLERVDSSTKDKMQVKSFDESLDNLYYLANDEDDDEKTVFSKWRRIRRSISFTNPKSETNPFLNSYTTDMSLNGSRGVASFAHDNTISLFDLEEDENEDDDDDDDDDNSDE